MGSDQIHVFVKLVKLEVSDEWDESMPLPGDDSFVTVKAKSELSSRLGKINPQVEFIWLKVSRGDSTLKLQARVVQQKSSMLKKKYTIQAANDHGNVVDLGDLTLEQCTELQGMQPRKLSPYVHS